MKIYFIPLILFGLMNITCSSSSKTKNNIEQINNKQEIEKIELTEQTRGTNRKITFTSNNLKTSVNNNNISDSEITSSEWVAILKETNKLDLSKISTYQSTTTGRFSDRALSSKIIISSEENLYQSSTFDSGNPPAELKNLYNEIQKIIATKKSR